jgi:hypothetical protein
LTTTRSSQVLLRSRETRTKISDRSTLASARGLALPYQVRYRLSETGSKARRCFRLKLKPAFPGSISRTGVHVPP